MFNEHVHRARELARQHREREEAAQLDKKLRNEAQKQAAQDVLQALYAFECYPTNKGVELRVATDHHSPVLRGTGQPGEYVFGLAAGDTALVTVRVLPRDAKIQGTEDGNIYRIIPGGHWAKSPEEVLKVISEMLFKELDPDCTDKELALRQAAAEGDEAAKNALTDYLYEHGRGPGRVQESA